MKKGGGLESIQACSDLRAPQLRIRPRLCPISGVRDKIIIIIITTAILKHRSKFPKNIIFTFSSLLSVKVSLILLEILRRIRNPIICRNRDNANFLPTGQSQFFLKLVTFEGLRRGYQ